MASSSLGSNTEPQKEDVDEVIICSLYIETTLALNR